jgi:peptidoglycan/xylan/chitin deacetylase (PgdA/CDA1 family)
VRRRRVVAVALLLAAGIAVALAAGIGGGDDGGVERRAGPATPKRHRGAAPPDTAAATTRRVPPSARDRPVPILMYHLVNDPPPGAPFPGLYVAAADFSAQIGWLKREGYTGVTLRQVYDLWTRGVPLPPHPVVVSFDDGYRSVWASALPVLRRMKWPAVLNLELKVLGNTKEGGLTESMVRELISSGWEVDSHTVSHPDLTTVDPTRLRDELVRSRAEIRRTFHQPADFFCYPAGRYDASVAAAVKRAGYLGATTTNFGNATRDQLFTLNRVRVDRSDGLAGFESKLTGLRPRGD